MTAKKIRLKGQGFTLDTLKLCRWQVSLYEGHFETAYTYHKWQGRPKLPTIYGRSEWAVYKSTVYNRIETPTMPGLRTQSKSTSVTTNHLAALELALDGLARGGELMFF